MIGTVETASRECGAVYYGRRFPATFVRARGATLEDQSGRTYIDLFAAAGALNYGHNPAELTAALRQALDDGIPLAALDFQTLTRQRFMEAMASIILEPRGMPHRIQFVGPTGTNAVEAALRLARKVRGTPHVGCMSGAYHGMSLGSLAVSDRPELSGPSFANHSHVVRLHHPDDGGTLEALDQQLSEWTGPERLAAIVVETVQGDGGARALDSSWLLHLSEYCQKSGTLLIVDDIQAGCGRTGSFFSFDHIQDFRPHIVCLSKSLSGSGLPMSINLIHPDVDAWKPGEHTGTFRGNSLAMVTGTEALKTYWSNPTMIPDMVAEREALVRDLLAGRPGQGLSFEITGRGLLLGLKFQSAHDAQELSADLFKEGVIAETCGPQDGTLKIIPPLTIGLQDLTQAIGTLKRLISGRLQHDYAA
jgi:diaminobutyrate-2-oxoglutarate transaminase